MSSGTNRLMAERDAARAEALRMGLAVQAAEDDAEEGWAMAARLAVAVKVWMPLDERSPALDAYEAALAAREAGR